MAKSLRVLLFLVAGCSCMHADPVILDMADPPSEWKAILDALSANQPVKSAFEESRSNPFHKRPRRFTGEIFWHPEYGLSLQYHSPGEMKINVSDQQVILYRSGESPRRMEVDGENPALGMFFKLFDWDMAWLDDYFSITGELDESGWRLQMRPNDEEAGRKLSRIDLAGSGDLLQSIRLDFPAGREVIIKLSDQQIPWEPELEFLRQQFEKRDDQD